jgi:hypothetical protein
LLVLSLVCAALSMGQSVGQSAGQYAGTWASDAGVSSGKVHLTLNGSGDSGFAFTYQDQLIKPKKVTAKVTGSQVEFVCEVDLEGFKLKSTFQGAIEGKNISGKYQSVSLDDGSALDSGTWKVTQQ